MITVTVSNISSISADSNDLFPLCPAHGAWHVKQTMPVAISTGHVFSMTCDSSDCSLSNTALDKRDIREMLISTYSYTSESLGWTILMTARDYADSTLMLCVI